MLQAQIVLASINPYNLLHRLRTQRKLFYRVAIQM